MDLKERKYKRTSYAYQEIEKFRENAGGPKGKNKKLIRNRKKWG